MMATFKALNIESDDESDIIVDDTKEIQIEESLKLYQTALRYHAEGPASFDQASKAYKELFNSEIFQYPESQIELHRIDQLGPSTDSEALWDDLDSADLTNLNTFDTGPSTLPQILHLSHKNYAQFKLEWLAARLDGLQASVQHILAEATEALDHFVSALDKDDTDVDLWKKTAAVGELLESRRITRLCLETSLDNDDDGINAVLNIPSLEDSIAHQQLATLVSDLDDHLSSIQLASTSRQGKNLFRHFKFNIDRFRGIVNRVLQAKLSSHQPENLNSSLQLGIKLPRTWAELGDMLVNAQRGEEYAALHNQHPSIWHFDMPVSGTPYLTPPQDAMLDDVPVQHETVSMMSSALLPSTIAQQFPGLDNGQPPAEIGPMQGQDISENGRPTTATSDTAENPNVHEVALPSRKRSGDTAGLTENGEEGRSSRSKRIRARDAIADPVESKQALQDANIQWEYDQHLKETQAADDWLYETVGPYFARLGVGTFETIKDVKACLQPDSISPVYAIQAESDSSSIVEAQQSLYTFLQNYNDRTARSMLHSGGRMDMIDAPRAGKKETTHGAMSNGINTEQKVNVPDEMLYDFLTAANVKHIPLQEVAADFVTTMTFPGGFSGLDGSQSSYTTHTWQENLKAVVARAIVTFDSVLYKRAVDAFDGMDLSQDGLPATKLSQYRAIRGWIQNMFELHLDVYSLIKRVGSGVDASTVALQADRLDRWYEVLREVSRIDTLEGSDRVGDSLDTRLLWASTFYIAGLEDTPQDRALAYMQDLRKSVAATDQTLTLANNAIMPEVSLSALDREISQLTTKDFFDKISAMEASDPAALIESIEPLLEAVEARSQAETHMEKPDLSSTSVPLDLILFLENGGPKSVMQLWCRLLDAYTAVGYKPMIVRTLFRIMRLAASQIENDSLQELEASERTAAVLTALRLIQRLTADILETVRTSDDALECLDENDLHYAVALYEKVLRLLQTFNVFEDPIRIGRSQAPMSANGQPLTSFKQFSKVLHEMQLQVWTVLYGLLKEAIKQNDELFPTPHEDRFDFLRTLHRNLGLRLICGGLNRSFIRMLKDEFTKLSHVDGYDSEQAQVLYDLYGLNYFLNPGYELMEHHCTHDAFLDRGVAQDTVDMLLAQAGRLSIKDLVKHTLKDAIDKIHGALTRKKPTDAILRNRETIRAYLRSPINPVNIFRSFRGESNELSMAPVPEGDAFLAAKGWYYLMGHIALVKFRTAKRTGPTPTEDIDIAIAFFMQELEYSVAQWETWFRLGQAYDTKLEESVAWSAEKLNGAMPDIIQLQRAIIHCYTMAIALAFRSAKPVLDMADKMTELYTEFAMRIYSSSRAPFSMLVFSTDVSERYLSSRGRVEKRMSFEPLTSYAAWKLAKVLFQRAIVGNPKQWTLHYHLTKCLWKMHTADSATIGQARPPKVQEVLSAIYRAIELLPGKKESRDSKKEPVLEPHYKLVSTIHKLVCRNMITLDSAKEALDHTAYARKVDFPANREGWTEYILAVLKSLRAADKANWHHRMIARSAQVIWEDERQPDKHARAASAKHELTQQLFTKTMVLQVWRPEAERPGRHFVYCARYTRFFVKILELVKDRVSLDLLARRVRRRTHEIFEHSLVWQDIVSTHLRLLRSHAQVTEGLEISTFSNIHHEDFLPRKESLEKWMQSQESGNSSVLDVLREVLELKKVNQNLMKTGPIDDLIGDLYACLFNSIGKQLWEEERKQQIEREAEITVEHTPAPPAPPEPVSAPPRNMMNLANLMNVVEPAAIEPALVEPTPVAEATIGAEAPIKKKTGIGRREIRSAADGCIYKPPSANGSARHSISSDNPRPSAFNKTELDAMSGDERENSVAGSIVDDADDESELSELEEVAEDEITISDEGGDENSVPVVKPLFPHLANGPAVDESTVDEDGGDKDKQLAEGSAATSVTVKLPTEGHVE